MTTHETKTIRVGVRGYEALMELRELLKTHGAEALPPEFAAIIDEEQAGTDEAFARGAVHAICCRVALELARAHCESNTGGKRR